MRSVVVGRLWNAFARCKGALKSGHAGCGRRRGFAQARDGDVAMLFGLMALALFMFIGLAVDFGRFMNARNQTLAAADAAVLAGARTLQTNGGNQAAALAVANTYYKQAVNSRITVTTDTIGFVVADNGTAVKTTGNVIIKTPFMGLGGTSTLQLLKSNGDDYAKAVLAVGANAETNLEISMMLDISGSMGENTKLSDLKAAASDLIDIVVWKDQTKYTSKVAIVPFSGDVRPTSSLLSSSTNPTYASSVILTSGSGRNQTTTTYKPSPCVAERGGLDYADTAPGVGHYVLREYTSNGSCSIDTNATLVPLTNDTTTLKAKVQALVSGGNTAGHVGTAWTYYMLSPKWASVLPTLSKPVAYGTADTKKIAVLMTDGEYNQEHDANGVATGSTGAGSSVNVVDSPTQAKSICSSMKANGIEVYTVGFDLGSNATAINTLQNCASDSSHFYNSATGDALRAAFRDIALKISTLYLAQ